MSGMDFEYAIKKDIRNNPIVREVDEARQRQLWRTWGSALFLVVVLLFSAWQHFELLRHGYRDRADAAGARRRRGSEPAPAPGGRDAEGAAPHRADRDRTAAPRARPREGRRSSSSASRPPRLPKNPSSPRADHRWVPLSPGSSRCSEDVRGARLGSRREPRRATGARRCARALARVRRRARALDRRHRGAAGLPAGRRARGAGGPRRPPAEPHRGAAGQARRDPRPQGTRAGLQRRRRHRSPRSRPRSRTRPTSPRRSAPRSTAAARAPRRRSRRASGAARSFAYIARKVTPEEAKRVRALALPGITLLKESRRYYPNSELAAHVVGYVGLDNVGLGGIESAYDAQIRGKDGKTLIQTDAKRHAIFSRVERPATAGAGVELTIDQYLQHIAERELRAGVEENSAAGGTAIVMDPQTGEILALANWPTYNPNAFGKSDDDARRNRAIAEPVRAGIDVQDRHRVRGARAAGDHAGDDGRDQPRAHHLPGPQADLRHAPLRHARRSPTSS